MISSKLLQEPHIIPPELAYIVDPIFPHDDALRPHPEGKTAEACRVVAAVAQHHRVDHPRARYTGPEVRAVKPIAERG